MAEDACFRPEHKLAGAEDFAAVFGRGRVVRGPLFDLHYHLNGTGSARLGLVIPKRNARQAVLRNRCKRLAREAFRLRRPGLPAYDLVLRLARPVKPDGSAHAAIRGEIDRLLALLPNG